jgi:hypothetical protein
MNNTILSEEDKTLLVDMLDDYCNQRRHSRPFTKKEEELYTKLGGKTKTVCSKSKKL